MIVKTKRYRLTKKTYRKLAFRSIVKRQWWVSLIVIAICSGYLWIQHISWFIGAGAALVLYLLFWWVQFYGVTQLEQGKMLFEQFAYEINSQQILMKINAREGMPIKWEQIKRAEIGKDYFLLSINKAQLIHLPFRLFKSENERKFLKSVLKNKGLIAG